MTDFVIPDGHFTAPRGFHPEAFVPSWEAQLRKRVAAEPDPSKRFEGWLTALAKDEWMPGVRLVLCEQPYLSWAELVEAVLKTAEKNLRTDRFGNKKS